MQAEASAGERAGAVRYERRVRTNIAGVPMVVCCINYTLDPRRIAEFERYATTWPPIIARCGGALVGYFLPKEGANNFALALIEFASLADYERYRGRLAADDEARANVADAVESGCILVEDRCFLRRP